ncbi:MAG TPA: ABC-2 transporter permease [Limnochordia bacterium]|nr:ABC-2 transporter permease [Limnochordia bacterium]HPU65692.1 ABC-2 transporter permease [Limnochordia bacterium]
MSKLLYKELRLAAHPNLYVFTLLGALILVPAYPYGMVFMFGCLGPFITMGYARETNDLHYTALLPIGKRDIVKGKCLLFAAAQLAQVLISLPFAFLRVRVLPAGNPAGIEANAAFYGFGLIIYAIFNFIFLTEFFRTGFKVGKAFLLAIVPASVVVLTMEVLAHIPAFAWLDSVQPADLLRQLPILLAGLAIYPTAMLAAFTVAAKRFEKVNL